MMVNKIWVRYFNLKQLNSIKNICLYLNLIIDNSRDQNNVSVTDDAVQNDQESLNDVQIFAKGFDERVTSNSLDQANGGLEEISYEGPEEDEQRNIAMGKCIFNILILK